MTKSLLERAAVLIDRTMSKFDMDAIATGHGGPKLNVELREWMKDYSSFTLDAWHECLGCSTPGDCRMHGCGVARGLWKSPQNRDGN